jgi:hypothetical protein
MVKLCNLKKFEAFKLFRYVKGSVEEPARSRTITHAGAGAKGKGVGAFLEPNNYAVLEPGPEPHQND